MTILGVGCGLGVGVGVGMGIIFADSVDSVVIFDIFGTLARGVGVWPTGPTGWIVGVASGAGAVVAAALAIGTAVLTDVLSVTTLPCRQETVSRATSSA